MSEPTTPTGEQAHEKAWAEGEDWEPSHTPLPLGCPACAFLARIEREAAQQERERLRAEWMSINRHSYASVPGEFVDAATVDELLSDPEP